MISYNISFMREQIAFHLGTFGFQCKCMCDGEEKKGAGKGEAEGTAFDGRNPLQIMLFVVIKYSSLYF